MRQQLLYLNIPLISMAKYVFFAVFQKIKEYIQLVKKPIQNS